MFKIFSTYIYWINKKNAASVGLRCGTTTKVAVRRQMVKWESFNISAVQKMYKFWTRVGKHKMIYAALGRATLMWFIPIAFTASQE
jgi:hypothetical protein